jgi:flagellar biosynthesis/type III secretory pathway protein FliH
MKYLQNLLIKIVEKKAAAIFEQARLEGHIIGYKEGLIEARELQETYEKYILIVKVAFLDVLADAQLYDSVRKGKNGDAN